MIPKEKAKKISEELDRAVALLKKTFSFEIVRPNLCLGDQSLCDYITISSMRDLARVALVEMAYDDEMNNVFVPDRLINEFGFPPIENYEAHRIYCFLHECIHVFTSQENPQLREKVIKDLFDSKVKSEAEKGGVYHVFCEGLAVYVANQVAQQSGNPALIKKSQIHHKELTDFFNEWLSSRGFNLIAQVHGLDLSEWQKVMLRYLQEAPGFLIHHKYDFGYKFISTIQPDVHEVRNMIASPPWKIQHLLWPEKYFKDIKIKK